ncbi:MAG: amidohydrolase family protein [Candidatus Bipolaricaulota bacterium]|nr:amidohydrolase family protein [Candidatus Bipolaricaulota bacterium]
MAHRLGVTSIQDAQVDGRMLKAFSDGSIGAGTVAMSRPYIDNPERSGLLIWDKEKLEEIVLKAHKNNIQFAIHAIGDRAITLVLDCLEKANSQQEKDLRHRIEHAEMITPKQIIRMKKMKIIASMQPNFIG